MNQEVIDPVCGMTIRPEEAAATLRRGDVTHYFCAVSCKETFERKPQDTAAASCCGGGHCSTS